MEPVCHIVRVRGRAVCGQKGTWAGYLCTTISMDDTLHDSCTTLLFDVGIGISMLHNAIYI